MESTEERILHYQRGIERSVAVLDKPRLLHCIKALSKLPVTMKHLKSTGIGRTVNSLRKIEEGVGDASKKLVTKWKEMVSNAPDSGESDEACVPDDPDNYESVNYEQEYADDGEDNAAVQSDSYNGISMPEALDKPVLSPPMVIDVNVSPEEEPAPNLSEEEEEEPEEPEETNYIRSIKHSSSKEKEKDSKKESKSSSSNSKSSESKDKRESSKVSKSSKDNGHEEHKKKDKDRSKSSSSSSKKHSSEVKKRKVEESSEDDESNRKKLRLSVCENESDDNDDDEEANNFVIDDDERNGQSSSDERDNNEAKEKSRDASSLKHSDSKSKSKDKRSSSSSSSSKSKSKKDDKHKSKSSSHSSSNGKDKDKHSKSKDDEKSKTKDKKEHKKSKEHKEKKKSKKTAVEGGIDSTTGTSFADALGMCSMPPPKKKKESSSKSSSKSEQSSPSKSKSKIEQRPVSPSEDSPEDSLRLLSPNVKLEPLTGDINEEVDLASTLPEPSPYYKPLPQVNIAQRRADEEDMLTIAINNKVQRTKVYSGNKSGWTNVPTMQEICIRVLIENIDALEYTGGVPYDILQPILERASADQLQRLEYYNPYLVEETDQLWKFHCNKIFKTKQREEMESWRDMYERCMSEREAKFKAITANIKQSIDKSAPVRSTKLAYVDHFVKPPRNVLRQQAKYGTAKIATSTSDLKKKLITGAAGPSSSSSSSSGSSSTSAERISVPPPPPSRSRPPSSHPIKKAKAPLMAKALQAIKGRYKR